MDHPKRSLVKAITWRFFGWLTTLVIVYIYSGSVKEALTVSIIVDGGKIVLYYLHERLWNKVNFGKPKQPEYQI